MVIKRKWFDNLSVVRTSEKQIVTEQQEEKGNVQYPGKEKYIYINTFKCDGQETTTQTIVCFLR